MRRAPHAPIIYAHAVFCDGARAQSTRPGRWAAACRVRAGARCWTLFSFSRECAARRGRELRVRLRRAGTAVNFVQVVAARRGRLPV